MERYKKDRAEWSQVCQYVNVLIDGLQKLPPEVYEQYFQ